MHFRIGGTAADALSFVDDFDLETASKIGDDLVLTGTWSKLMAVQTGKIIKSCSVFLGETGRVCQKLRRHHPVRPQFFAAK